MVADAPPLSDELARWSDRFGSALVDAMLERLGVAPRGSEEDRALADLLIKALATRHGAIDRIFFDWRGGRDPGSERYPAEPFRALAVALAERSRLPRHPYWSEPAPCSMHIEEVEAIWSAIAEDDDWQPLQAKVAAIRRMGEAMLDEGTDAA